MIGTDRTKTYLLHAGLPGGQAECFDGDVEQLEANRLVDIGPGKSGGSWFNVTPYGYHYYREYKERLGEPERQVEMATISYLESADFQRRYPQAHAKWSAAVGMLWEEKPEALLSMIGYRCREAMQEFASALVETHKPPGVDPQVANTKNRVIAVMNHVFGERVSTPRAIIDTAISY